MKELLEKIKLFFFKTNSSHALVQQALQQQEKNSKLRQELLEVNHKIQEIKEEARELQASIEEDKEVQLADAELAYEEMVARLKSQHLGQLREIKEQANSEISALEEIFKI